MRPYFNKMHFVCCTTRKNYGGVAILYNEDDVETNRMKPVASVEEESKENTLD